MDRVNFSRMRNIENDGIVFNYMKAVIYTAYDKSIGMENIETQKEICEKYLSILEGRWEIVNYYSDGIVSEDISLEERPEFKKLLNELEEGFVIIVADINVFGRSIKRGFFEELREKGIYLFIGNMDNKDNLSLTGNLIIGIFLSFHMFFHKNKKLFYHFYTGKNNKIENFYKETCRIENLEKILDEFPDDEWISIMSSNNMKTIFHFVCQQGTLQTNKEEILKNFSNSQDETCL